MIPKKSGCMFKKLLKWSMCIAFSRIMLLPQICCSGISLFIFQGTEILHYYSMISAIGVADCKEANLFIQLAVA